MAGKVRYFTSTMMGKLGDGKTFYLYYDGETVAGKVRHFKDFAVRTKSDLFYLYYDGDSGGEGKTFYLYYDRETVVGKVRHFTSTMMGKL